MGPLLTNSGVDTTLHQFQAMEAAAPPSVLGNWRFQQALYRANYDYYNRKRLVYETHLEDDAMDALRRARTTGSTIAMDEAEEILRRSVTQPVSPTGACKSLRTGGGVVSEHPDAVERQPLQSRVAGTRCRIST